MMVYEFADGSWTDEQSVREDNIDVSTAVLVAEVDDRDFESPWFATIAAAALNRARQREE
jgi:hypothetical protein